MRLYSNEVRTRLKWSAWSTNTTLPEPPLSCVVSPPRPRETAAAVTISIVLRHSNGYCNVVWCSAVQGEARQRLGIIPSIPSSSSPIDATPGRISPCSPPSSPFIPTSLAIFYLEILFWQKPRMHVCTFLGDREAWRQPLQHPPDRDSKRNHRLGPIW
ncbi:hypothetical protein CMEL01_12743 [Colletotrichum melonis]|uniref:Uncharacterized protein n=1 Tax=Colletotrichum melonis TaxID=1209925 RepID=A0AAI9USL7_9PEZI|nr:hypothetical protein CMEL01_12743 [Colletotrichum melonis]